MVTWQACIRTFLHVEGLDGGTRRKATKHFLILAHANTLALNGMNVFQTAENLMVDLESHLDLELGTFLDGEGLVLEGFYGFRGR